MAAVPGILTVVIFFQVKLLNQTNKRKAVEEQEVDVGNKGEGEGRFDSYSFFFFFFFASIYFTRMAR